jgi:putative transposase
MDNQEIGKYELSAYWAVLASQLDFAKNLNSMAGQARTERAWSVISRCYDNCKNHKPRKKGYPRLKKEQTHGSVEYETSGWKLSEKQRYIAILAGVVNFLPHPNPPQGIGEGVRNSQMI